MPDSIYIQHRFTEKRSGFSEYSDAIVLPKDEYEKLTPSDIEAIKEERYTNWRNIIDNPPKPVEPTKEDLEAQAQAIDEQIVSLQAQKVQVSEAILTAKPKPIIEQIKDKIEEVIGGQ